MGQHTPPGFYVDHQGNRRWWDGAQWGSTDLELGYVAPAAPGAVSPVRRAGVIIVSVVLIVTLLAGAAAALVRVGVHHWDKVVVPEHPETFSWTTQNTGVFHVRETSEPLCWVDQDWFACVNAVIDEYNSMCVGHPLDSDSALLCREYETEGRRLQGIEAFPGAVVVSGGDFYHLETHEITRDVRVSNNDYKPAQTRRATCFFGVFGECPTAEDLNPLSPAQDDGPVDTASAS